MIRLRIVHETNPEKYFPALYLLADRGDLRLVGANRYSVVKEWLRAWRRDRTPFFSRSRNALADLAYRLRLPFISGETVVLGFAPWDWRLLFFRGLRSRNRIVYHTSWHDWDFDRTPRQPRPATFGRWLQQKWLTFLAHPDVKVVAVTPNVADALQKVVATPVTVIPHSVPDMFYEAGSARGALPRESGLRMLYVGELSQKKGVPLLLGMMGRLRSRCLDITLTVVGTGPLAAQLRIPHEGVTYLGQIRDRRRLAEIMASHDVLVVPSQRTPTWEELFGIVVIEAIAAGTAVIASNHIGPRLILEPANGAGLFDEDDHAGIEAEIAALAVEKGRLESLRSKQIPLAKSYRIDVVAGMWKKVLER